MRLRVLGCSGAIARGERTTAFLVDDDLLVDAGTGVGELTLQQMARIDHVLLTHSHLDHVAALPLMLDSVATLRSNPVELHALPETIAALRRHLFNDEIWPDFSALPSPENPLLRFDAIAVGQLLQLGAHRVEVLPASHSVPAAGYAIATPRGHWVYSGDTGPNPALWRRLNAMPLAMLVIENAFSQHDAALAAASRHLCPRLLAAELAQLRADPGLPVGLMHAKPAQRERMRAEVEALGTGRRLVWLESGQSFDF